MDTSIAVEKFLKLKLSDYKKALVTEKLFIKKATAVIFLGEYVFADNKKGLGILWYKKMSDANNCFKELKKHHPVTKLALGESTLLKDTPEGATCRVTIRKGGLPEEKIQDKSDKWFDLQKVALEIVMAVKPEAETEELQEEPDESPLTGNETTAPAPTANASPAAPVSTTDIPAWWPKTKFIGPSSFGQDVHFLRVKVNMLLKKEVLKLDADPDKSRFNDTDAIAVKKIQQMLGLLASGKPGIASGATLDVIKSISSLPDPNGQGNAPDVDPFQFKLSGKFPQGEYIGWGSKGEDVYNLRIRLNQTLYGRINNLPLPEKPADAIFMKLDSDAIFKFQQMHKLILPGWQTKGGGTPGVAKGDTLRLIADPNSNPSEEFKAVIANQNKILSGKTKEMGAYDPEKGFTHPDAQHLQATIEYYCKEMGIDWKKLDEKEKPKTQGGGDTPTDGVGGMPSWIGAFQNRIIDSPSWGKEEASLSAVLNAYLTAHYTEELKKQGKELPPSVSMFFDHVGKSEANGTSNDLADNSAGTADWCAYASSSALAKALEKAGLQVKMPAHAKKRNNPHLCASWLEKKGKNTFAPQAFSMYSAIEPGDIISYVTESSALTGHVVTVIAIKGDIMQAVSGNAGSKIANSGSVRVNEVRMVVPEDKNIYSKISQVKTKYKEDVAKVNARKKANDEGRKYAKDRIAALEKLAPTLEGVNLEQANRELIEMQGRIETLHAEKTEIDFDIQELRNLSASLRPKTPAGDKVVNAWVFSIQKASHLNKLVTQAVAEKWDDKKLAEYDLEWIPK